MQCTVTASIHFMLFVTYSSLQLLPALSEQKTLTAVKPIGTVILLDFHTRCNSNLLQRANKHQWDRISAPCGFTPSQRKHEVNLVTV